MLIGSIQDLVFEMGVLLRNQVRARTQSYDDGYSMAPGEGFEPSRPVRATGFQVPLFVSRLWLIWESAPYLAREPRRVYLPISGPDLIGCASILLLLS